VGIKLHITPTINTDGFITVKVNPEVSSITELVQGLYPRKKVRTATTTVLVKDGERIFIGGLLSVDDSEVEYKMPVLANLPILGKFFTHKYYSTRKTDLLIQITPRIVREGISYSDADNLTSQGNFDADNLTSQGNFILNQGDIVDIEEVMEPEMEGLDSVASGINEMESELDKAKVPLSERLKEQGY
jgi:Flp pilus assembly secretin CpaC